MAAEALSLFASVPPLVLLGLGRQVLCIVLVGRHLDGHNFAHFNASSRSYTLSGLLVNNRIVVHPLEANITAATSK